MNERFETNNTPQINETITVPQEMANMIGSTGVAAAVGERGIITGIPESLSNESVPAPSEEAQPVVIEAIDVPGRSIAVEGRHDVVVPTRVEQPASHRSVVVPPSTGRIAANPERTLGHPANRAMLEREADIARSENRGPGRR